MIAGNRDAGRGDQRVMRCEDCRDAISARLDDEGSEREASAVDAHLDTCPDCRGYAERAARVTRLTRTRVAEPGPDLVAAVLAAAPPPASRSRVPDALRLGLGAVGVGQFALAVTGIVAAGGHGHGAVALSGASPAHFANESSAWNLALAVAFLLSATGTRRTGGVVPIVGAFVGMLAVLSMLDVLGGRVDPSRLLTHGLAVAGLALVLALRRTGDDGGGARSGPRVTDDPVAPAARPATGSGPALLRRDPTGGPRPSAGRRVA